MTRAQPSQGNPMAGVARARLVGTVVIPQVPQAIPLPRTTPRRGLLQRVGAAVRAAFATRTPEPRQKRKYYKRLRESFMEEAAMGREMHRL